VATTTFDATPIRAVLGVLTLFLVAVALCNPGDAQRENSTPPSTPTPAANGSSASATTNPDTPPADPPVTGESSRPWTTSLPGGGSRIFDKKRFLVAYYGTARTAALGVLGERPADQTMPRLWAAARPFKKEGERIQPVFELIVTVADARPGKDGDFNHDIRRAYVERYIAAARRNKALLVLDIQPGRSPFPDVARRWEWALKDPWVGLALDPEWRMSRNHVPGRVIGSVGADEINRTAAWLSALTRREGLPEKIFMLHQFRSSMVRNIGQVKARPGLAMIQHVDGFGNPGQKIGTYRAVSRPQQFTMGFKLFYDEDRPRMRPADVRRLSGAIRFVSFQ
jgi:hypothetical protein